ncbi:MAG: hypothetical protein HQ469_01340 [Cyanobacteria bacterium]|nr:hypothetical protein [Cyanobacteria bacterium bin.275]
MTGYEFSEHENLRFKRISNTLRIVAIVIIILGTLDFFTLIYSYGKLMLVERVLAYLTLAVMAWTTYRFIRTYRAMRDIVRTAGNDVALLLSSLKYLDGALIGVVFIILGHVFGTFAFHEMMYGPYKILNEFAGGMMVYPDGTNVPMK